VTISVDGAAPHIPLALEDVSLCEWANPSLPFLESLDFGLSPIGEPASSVALDLSTLLPEQCKISSLVLLASGNEEEAITILRTQQRMWSQRWEEVAQLVPLLVKARKEERERARRLFDQFKGQAKNCSSKVDIQHIVDP